jgi:hypothetical protein
LRAAQELAKAVADDDCGRYPLVEDIAAVGKDCGDAGVEAIALLESEVTHPHSRHIGDGVVWAGREYAELETEFARAWFRLVRVGPAIAIFDSCRPGREQAESHQQEQPSTHDRLPPGFGHGCYTLCPQWQPSLHRFPA